MEIVKVAPAVPPKSIPTLLAPKPDLPSSPTENCLPLPDRLISRKELRQMIPVSDQTIWRWERDGLFPRRVRLIARFALPKMP